MNKIYLFGFIFGAFVVTALLVTANVIKYDSQRFANSGVLTPRVHPGVVALATYTNDEYGFEIRYPVNLKPETSFKQFYALGSAWRAATTPESKGEALVAIPVFRVDRGGVATGQPYPLYYSTEVRVGVSTDKADVQSCLQPDAGYTEQAVTDTVINGVPFKRFIIQDAAMMQYLKAISYRTVHQGTCYALEQVAAGSNYRDPTMLPGLSEAELTGYFDQAGSIVQMFQFTK